MAGESPSSVVAIILGEPRSEELAVHLENAIARLVSAAIRVELGIGIGIGDDFAATGIAVTSLRVSAGTGLTSMAAYQAGARNRLDRPRVTARGQHARRPGGSAPFPGLRAGQNGAASNLRT